jgi:hypothetical protein
MVGVGAAVAGARVFGSMVHGVQVRDPVSVVAAVLLALLGAFIATAFPATAATRVSPVVAMRQ